MNESQSVQPISVPVPGPDDPLARPSLLLPPGVAKLAQLCAKDTGRYACNGILLTSTVRGYQAAATNGRVLGVVSGALPAAPEDFPTIPAMSNAPNGEAAAIVPVKTWTEAFRDAPKKNLAKPILENVLVVIGQDETTFGSTDLATASVRVGRNVEGWFPDWRRVVHHGPPKARFHVNAALLIDLLKAAMAYGADDEVNRVTVEFWDGDGDKNALTPVVVRASMGPDGPDFLGIIMPLT